jgi:outer membrane receptor protein involved in Fe transport
VPATDITRLASGQVATRDDLPRSAAFTDYDPQVTVMPRVGVSFPVTDRALFFASYNVTSQRPTEQAFAPIARFDGLTGQDLAVPNPTLEPEKTTQYELGFRQRLGERAALTLSGFYRTQENKIASRTATGGLPEYGTFFNEDFTTTKGVEVGFDLRRTNNLAITANYTLAFAEGTGSDASTTQNLTWLGLPYPRAIEAADFDQRHTANFTVDYRFGEDEGPMVGGVRLLENFGINVLGQFGSGGRYTALAATGGIPVNAARTAQGIFETGGAINGATLPPTARIDLKVDRSFNLFGRSQLKAYLWVQNLLDADNVVAVYRTTGLPDEDNFLTSSSGQSFLNGFPVPEAADFNYRAYAFGPVNNATVGSNGTFFYGLPRRVRLGLLFDF